MNTDHCKCPCKCTESCAPNPCCCPLSQTNLCGRVVGLDLKPKVKVPVIVRLVQVPLTVGGTGLTNEQVSTETDADGCFQLTLLTGALVSVQIPSMQYNKQFVVPPQSDPSVPVRLLSL